jgi:hypothetical protein
LAPTSGKGDHDGHAEPHRPAAVQDGGDEQAGADERRGQHHGRQQRSREAPGDHRLAASFLVVAAVADHFLGYSGLGRR